MQVIPYDFRQAKDKNCNVIGYWIKIYCMFDGKSVHWFAHQYDLLDNQWLCHDLGVRTTLFTQSIFVDRDNYPDIYKEIEDYVHGTRHD